MSEEFSYTRAQLCERYGLNEVEVGEWGKGRLEYMKDYRPHRTHGMVFKPIALTKLDAFLVKAAVDPHGLYEDEKWEWGVVTADLPPNPRWVWVKVHGHDGKGFCNIPLRMSRLFRVPGKRIPVRHVSDNVWQIVIPKWNDLVEGRLAQ